jgi:rubredoxin
LEKWICTVCDYVYDPVKGDKEHDIMPSMPFEDLPFHWRCPECGVSKEMFEKVPQERK